MAGEKIAKEDAALLKSLRKTAKGYVGQGVSAGQAMRRAVDEEISSVTEQLASVREQAEPPKPRSTEKRDALRSAVKDAEAATARLQTLLAEEEATFAVDTKSPQP